MKQISEKRFRMSLQHAQEGGEHLWYMKLQSNMLAHTSNVGDFLVNTPLFLHAVEVKQVTMSRDKPKLNLSRITQEGALVAFSGQPSLSQQSWVLINFWTGSMKTSTAFLFTIESWKLFCTQLTKKSVTQEEMSRLAAYHQLKIQGLYWDLTRLLHYGGNFYG